MFSKILLCVDDSPRADQVAQVGADLARRYNAEVVVLSVLDPARFSTPPYSGLEGIHLVDWHSRSLTQTGSRIRVTLENLGIPNRHMLLPGRTAETVVEVAHQEKADLIVMGSETKSRLHAAVDGCLWTDVSRSAPCNVMRVLPTGESATGGSERRRKLRFTLPLGRRAQAVDPLAS